MAERLAVNQDVRGSSPRRGANYNQQQMTFYVYVLINKDGRIYVGQTNDISQRLLLHNEGKVRSTKPYRPWQIMFTEEYKTRSESMTREKWLKTGKGREYIREKRGSSIGPPEAD
jgi:putative endonuclease